MSRGPRVLGRIVQQLRQFPPVRRIRLLRHGRRFRRAGSVLHHGVYGTFAEALEALPEGATVGWDNREAATLPVAPLDRINPRDYPVLLWMHKLWSGEVTVLDFGGHVGTKRYAFERYLDFDADKRWIVCDVPEVIREGRRVASERGTPNLSFTADFSRAAGCSLLLCLGVLQFIEEPLGDRLRALDRLPPHIIANGVPLHPRFSYVTLVNNDGRGFCPYRVFARDELIASVRSCGYEVVDEWINAEKGCRIPAHEDHDVGHYSGFYFRQA